MGHSNSLGILAIESFQFFTLYSLISSIHTVVVLILPRVSLVEVNQAILSL